MRKGLWITFEGLDGSGKTTLLHRCAEVLSASGRTVVSTRNPGGTPFGMELRRILLESGEPVSPMAELLLFIADRAQHMEEVIRPGLAEGRVILCDRHLDSTVAYQGYGRGLPLETIHSLNGMAIGGKKPDKTFLLDGDPLELAERIQQRGVADRMEGERNGFHQRVREGFLALARQEPDRFVVLDAMKSREALLEEALRHLEAINLCHTE